MKYVLALIFIIIIVIFIVGYRVFANVMIPNNDIPAKKEDVDDPNHLCAPTTRLFYEEREAKKESFFTLKTQELMIKSFDGLDLYADLYEGKNTEETAILIHGYKSAGWKDFYNIIDYYKERQCNILILQNRGHGKSKAKYIGFSSLDQYDVLGWCQKVSELYLQTKIILHGVSMGGATVIHCSNKVDNNVKVIIDDCGFTSIAAITKHLMSRVYGIPYYPFGIAGNVWMEILGNTNPNQDDGLEEVKQARVPIMFVHGDQDHFVPVEMSKQMYENCCTRKELLIAKNCGHAACQSIVYDEYKEKLNKFINECN